jgi:pimeloyl-ACP methyl ester carboxylesterase
MKLSHILFISVLITAVLVTGLLTSSKLTHKIRQSVYGNNALTGKYYSINGFQMYCETYGSGQPLLMIHGNGGNITAFSKQIPFFSKYYKVIVADSRAQGKSTNPLPDSLTYEMMADDYAALLTTLHIDSANVIGWSDGGIIGLLMAMRHPEKIKKLAITGANLWPDSTAVDTSVLHQVTPVYQQMKQRYAVNGPKKVDDEINWLLLKLLIEQPHIALADLNKITAPTLVMSGDRDLIHPEHTLHIFKHIPNAQLWILPNCGHATLIDYADEFNKKVDVFFKMHN